MINVNCMTKDHIGAVGHATLQLTLDCAFHVLLLILKYNTQVAVQVSKVSFPPYVRRPIPQTTAVYLQVPF